MARLQGVAMLLDSYKARWEGDPSPLARAALVAQVLYEGVVAPTPWGRARWTEAAGGWSLVHPAIGLSSKGVFYTSGPPSGLSAESLSALAKAVSVTAPSTDTGIRVSVDTQDAVDRARGDRACLDGVSAFLDEAGIAYEIEDGECRSCGGPDPEAGSIVILDDDPIHADASILVAAADRGYPIDDIDRRLVGFGFNARPIPPGASALGASFSPDWDAIIGPDQVREILDESRSEYPERDHAYAVGAAAGLALASGMLPPVGGTLTIDGVDICYRADTVELNWKRGDAFFWINRNMLGVRTDLWELVARSGGVDLRPAPGRAPDLWGEWAIPSAGELVRLLAIARAGEVNQ